MKNRRILIIDDTPSLHDDYRKILTAAGGADEKVEALEAELFGEDPSKKVDAAVHFEVDHASQGEEGLKMVLAARDAGKPYAMAFVDIRMPPGWDGIFTIKKIWERAPDLQIAICSAHSDYSLSDIIRELGVSDSYLFLRKPFDSIEVQQMALALSTKWDLQLSHRLHTEELERLVEERTHELDRQRAQSLQSAKMSALGEMAGGIAHEINTPLGTISLCADQISEQLKDKTEIGRMDAQGIIPTIEMISKTVHRIAKIVHGLRVFSRDSSKEPMTSTSVQSIVSDTVSLCEARFASHGIRLHVPADDGGLSVICRPIEVSQVLLNLLNNAHDAILKIPDPWIKIEYAKKGDVTEIAVTDCGAGIPEDLRDKIMQPFFTTKDIGQGTGLGLSLAKGIMESHGGQLVYDDKGPNTRFVMRFLSRAQQKVS